jgi:hypothetical protein
MISELYAALIWGAGEGGGIVWFIFKTGRKNYVNSILGENCRFLKNFMLGKPPLNGPCYRWKKGLGYKALPLIRS